MRVPWIPVGVAVSLSVAILATLAFGHDEARAEPPAANPALPSVTVEAVELRPAERTHRYHGVIQPVQRATLSFAEGGRLTSRAVRVGDVVRRGAVLAHVDARPFTNAVAASRAAVEELDARRGQLRRDDRRLDRLFEQGAISDSDREQSSTGLERVDALQRAAKVQVRENQRRLAETVLRAPFDGVVTQVFAEPGELLQPGQPVAMLAGEDGYEVTVEVPASVANVLSSGMDVKVEATGLTEGDPLSHASLDGRVRSVAKTAARMRGLHPVVVDVDGERARAGLGVEVTWTEVEPASASLPLSAVYDPSGRRPYVWRVVEGRVQRAWVRLGSLEGERVWIREGIEPGDRIVVVGGGRLLPGDEVTEAGR